MSEEKPKYSNSASALQALTDAHSEIALLKTAVSELSTQLAAERENRVEYSRRTTLSTLAQEYEKVDVDKLLAKCKGLSDSDFADRVTEIKECYSRKPEAVRDFAGMAHGSVDVASSKDEAVTVENIVKYALAHQLDYMTARERYVAQSK